MEESACEKLTKKELREIKILLDCTLLSNHSNKDYVAELKAIRKKIEQILSVK